MHWRVGLWIDDDGCTAGDPADKLGSVGLADVSPQLGICKRALELIQQRPGRDQLRLARGERSQYICRCTA